MGMVHFLEFCEFSRQVMAKDYPTAPWYAIRGAQMSNPPSTLQSHHARENQEACRRKTTSQWRESNDTKPHAKSSRTTSSRDVCEHGSFNRSPPPRTPFLPGHRTIQKIVLSLCVAHHALAFMVLCQEKRSFANSILKNATHVSLIKIIAYHRQLLKMIVGPLSRTPEYPGFFHSR